MASLENRIPPPLVMAGLGLLMWLLAWIVGSGSFPMQIPLAVLIILAGFATAITAALAFRTAGTTINPVRIEKASTLVTAGLFQFSRNPMYVGMVAILIGWWIWLGSLIAVLGPIVFVWYIGQFQIVPEERVLAARFGAAFDAYRSKVRRWI